MNNSPWHAGAQSNEQVIADLLRECADGLASGKYRLIHREGLPFVACFHDLIVGDRTGKRVEFDLTMVPR